MTQTPHKLYFIVGQLGAEELLQFSKLVIKARELWYATYGVAPDICADEMGPYYRPYSLKFHFLNPISSFFPNRNAVKEDDMNFAALVLIMASYFFGKRVTFFSWNKFKRGGTPDSYVKTAHDFLQSDHKIRGALIKDRFPGPEMEHKISLTQSLLKQRTPEFQWQQVCRKLESKLMKQDVDQLRELTFRLKLKVPPEHMKMLIRNTRGNLGLIKRIYCKLLAEHFYRQGPADPTIVNMSEDDFNYNMDIAIRDLSVPRTYTASRTLSDGRTRRKAYDIYDLKEHMRTTGLSKRNPNAYDSGWHGDRSFDLEFTEDLKDTIDKKVLDYERDAHKLHHRER